MQTDDTPRLGPGHTRNPSNNSATSGIAMVASKPVHSLVANSPAAHRQVDRLSCRHQMARSDSTRATSQLLALVASIVAIAALYFARVVFIPFALAILFAFLLAPIVDLLDRIRIPRAASSLMVVAITVCGLGLLGWVVAGQLVDIANQLPSYRANINRKIDFLRNPQNQNINNAAGAVTEIGKELVAPGTASTSPTAARGLTAVGSNSAKPVRVEIVPPASNALESLNSLIGPVSVFGIVTVFTLFMLIRREDLRNRFIRLVGHGHLSVMTQALDDASRRVSRYLFLQLSVNVGFGLVVGTGLYFIGIPHVILWGVLVALLRFLPYVGSPLSALLPVLLSLAMFDGWTRPLLTIGLYAVVELIVSNLVEPFLYGAHVGLSSLAILVAAVFWTVLWGPIGLVLSTPLTVCVVVMGRYVPNLGFLNILLGDEPVLAPESHFYQRLLASDQHEAKQVLESYLAENTLQQLYDSVLVPALALAEQDRHRNDLDEATQQFITLSTKELVEELHDKANEFAFQGQQAQSATNTSEATRVRSKTVVCVPARDDADEIVATMLAQLLEQDGHRAQCIPLGTGSEMIALCEDADPDIAFVSALPPFARSHARNLYLSLRSRMPDTKIVVGLWGFAGDTANMAVHLRLREGDQFVVRLEQAIAEANIGAEISQDRNGKETTADRAEPWRQ
jgi:predicted PurR-regulated permease PerM